MGEIMSKFNFCLDITSKVPVSVICCVIAGIVIALVFIIAFFLELFIPKHSEEESEDVDVDAMLHRLDVATEKSEVTAKKEEETEKNYDELFAKLEEELNESKKQREEASKNATSTENSTTTTTVTTEITNRVVGPEFDYYQRLETINASLVKLEKDLTKSSREVRKYEKTEKRKARNEKLLDRKATELTNLNLVLYNVNDIKDIDPEKKERQESLVEHIAELKNSVSEADEYLVKNKEKYENAKKIKTFLEGEKERYEAEITELNALIAEAKKKNN